MRAPKTRDVMNDKPRERIAVYPGTFDPITNGHIDIIRRGLCVFDRLIITLAENVRKAPLFDLATRQELIREAVAEDVASGRVELDSFSGMIVDYCERKGASALLRGLRAAGDFEYEFQFAVMNRRLGRGIDSVFLMTAEENFYVSSSLVKEVASFGGDVSGLVPANVRRALERHFRKG